MASQFDVARKFTYCEKNSGIRVLCTYVSMEVPYSKRILRYDISVLARRLIDRKIQVSEYYARMEMQYPREILNSASLYRVIARPLLDINIQVSEHYL